LENTLKHLLILTTLCLLPATVCAELMSVDMTIVEKPAGGWSYVVVEGDRQEFGSDAELGDYLKRLSNPMSSIDLFIKSEYEVPVDQLIKIFALVDANPEGITVKRVVLGPKFAILGVGAAVAAKDVERPVAAKNKVVLEDNFEGDLAAGWSWIRQRAAHWCVRKGALEIRVVPGLAATVENALVRSAPVRSEGTYAIDVAVTNNSPPRQQWEQAGITWYQDGRPIFKLVKELVDGRVMIIPGRKPIDSKTVQLRLVVTADSYTAMYREEGQGNFQIAAKGKLPPGDNEQVSIQCYNGPPNAEHWMRFDNFRIVELTGGADSGTGEE
jgi:hypothetical protein